MTVFSLTSTLPFSEENTKGLQFLETIWAIKMHAGYYVETYYTEDDAVDEAEGLANETDDLCRIKEVRVYDNATGETLFFHVD